MASSLTGPTTDSSTTLGSNSRITTGRFMLTLCQLDEPVSIRQPQSPQLKRYAFFTSCVRGPNGGEQVSLHMGYFETLAMAERCADAVRHRYPNAFATVAPDEVSRSLDVTSRSLPRSAPDPATFQHGDSASVSVDQSLTDTQALRILESRCDVTFQDVTDESPYDQVALLRPDDTGTRRALKEAVAEGAPVSFAVQLQWSEQLIDLNRAPSMGAIEPHTLYAVESLRDGRRPRYFLRMGFFANPYAAKQAAVQVRSSYPHAAVVPVTDQEITQARDADRSASAVPLIAEQRVDRGSDSDETRAIPTQTESSRSRPGGVSQGPVAVKADSVPTIKRDIWSETDSLNNTGVRHLRIEMKEQSSGRWRILR